VTFTSRWRSAPLRESRVSLATAAMGKPMRQRIALALLGLCLLSLRVSGFKENEMKKCSDLFFCRTCVHTPPCSSSPAPRIALR
jgi:hypothetical protein